MNAHQTTYVPHGEVWVEVASSLKKCSGNEVLYLCGVCDMKRWDENRDVI